MATDTTAGTAEAPKILAVALPPERPPPPRKGRLLAHKTLLFDPTQPLSSDKCVDEAIREAVQWIIGIYEADHDGHYPADALRTNGDIVHIDFGVIRRKRMLARR